MTPAQMRKLDGELREYMETMVERMGRLERRRAMEQYLTGLLLDGERKSVEPMAGRLVEKASEREALRQRLQQCVAVADWSDEEMRRRLALKLEKIPADVRLRGRGRGCGGWIRFSANKESKSIVTDRRDPR